LGDAGLVVGSAATLKLTLGVLSPSFSAIKNHAKNILSAWAASLMLFSVLGVLALTINGMLTVKGLISLLPILLISNVIAFSAIIVLSFAISILTFKRGLDPDNFVIPIESSLADALTTVALFITILLIL